MDERNMADIQETLDAASRALRAGDSATARRLCASVLERDPHDARALDLLGVVCLTDGNLAAALESLDHAGRLAPDDAGVCRHRGAALLAVGRPGEAADAFRRALEIEPGDAETLFNLGLTERYLGHFDLAVDFLRRAVAPLAELPIAHYELGLALQLAGRPDEAARSYLDTLTLDPEHISALTNLGVVRQQGGDLDGAIAAYRHALTHQPDAVSALNNLGSALMERGDLAEAAQTLKRAALLDPTSVNALTNLGTVLRRMGDPAQAIEAYRAALEVDPVSDIAHDNLADCLRETGRADEAFDALRATITALPGHWRAHLLLGHELKRSGDPWSAIAAYRTATALADGAEAEAHRHLGATLAMTGALDGAVTELRRAVALRPDCPPYARELAAALLRRGDGAGAVAACDRALAVDRFDQEALAYRALGLRLAGDHVAADALVDLDRWIFPLSPPAPPEYDDLDTFNEALATDLLALSSRLWQPTYQSIRGGTQTGNNLFTESAPTIQALHRAIDSAVRAFMDTLAPDASHPFPAGKPRRFAYRAWSVVLEDKGYHVPHIHPEGWLSGAYYVRIPPFDDSGDADAGSIEFGPPWADLPFDAPPPARRVAPAAGRLVVFPSYFWHGVRRFRSAGQRITVAFDLLPLER